MTPDIIVAKTIEFVKHSLNDAEGGHDWWHVYRVWKTAVHIAREEKVDMLVVELGALLHDIADSKFHNGNEEIGPATVSYTHLDVYKRQHQVCDVADELGPPGCWFTISRYCRSCLPRSIQIRN